MSKKELHQPRSGVEKGMEKVSLGQSVFCQTDCMKPETDSAIQASPSDGERARRLNVLPLSIWDDSSSFAEDASLWAYQEDDPTQQLWVLGGGFARQFLTVLDFDKGGIGFAELSRGSRYNSTRLAGNIKKCVNCAEDAPLVSISGGGEESKLQGLLSLGAGVMLIACVVIAALGFSLWKRLRGTYKPSPDLSNDNHLDSELGLE